MSEAVKTCDPSAVDVGANDVDYRKALGADEGGLVDTAVEAIKGMAGKLADKLDPLTEREAAVLELIAKGQSNRQIALAMSLAEGTVKNHVSRIMQKLQANTRTELAVMVLGRR